MNTRDPLPELKVSNSLSLEVESMILKPPQKWQQETNISESSIMRRDKEVKEMPQETKESQGLEIEGG
jgi:hypothetical protein